MTTPTRRSGAQPLDQLRPHRRSRLRRSTGGASRMTGSVKPPRPGFVLDVDRSTPPVLFHHGESFRLEKLPPGRSRVIYPSEPLEPLDDIEGAIHHALLHPEGDSAPLPDLLTPGMKLTIAFDDISLPLPPMRRPDIRQRDHRAGARPGCGRRRRRRRAHRRAGPAPAHDRGRAAPRRRRPRLRLVRAPRPALQPRRRGPRQPDPGGHHRSGRGGGDQQARRRQRPARLREHQHRLHGRRLEEHGHRAGQLPQHPPPPQRQDDAALPVLHGPPPHRAALVELADGQGAARRRGEGLPDRDHHQQQRVRHRGPARACCRSASGSGRGATGSPSWA